MSKKHSNSQYVSERAMTPEDLVRRQNQEVKEMIAHSTAVDGYYGQKVKNSNGVFGIGLAGARLSSRPARLSDEEPMTAAEMELLAGDSKLPDDFRLDQLRNSTMKHMHNQDPGRMVKSLLATPSDFDKLIAKADALIVQMSRQNELAAMLLKHLTSSSMLANERIEPADVFHADFGDDK